MTEIKAPDGYILQDTPKTFEIKDGGSMELVFTNKKAYGLQIRKVVKWLQPNPPGGCTFTVEKANGEMVGLYTTDSSGLATVTGLEDGVYVVTEVSCPEGYRLDATPQNVIVKSGELATVTLRMKSSPVCALKGRRSDRRGYLRRSVPYHDEDNNLIGEYSTDQDGYIELDDLLTDGKSEIKLKVEEIAAAEGYVLDDTVRTLRPARETTEFVMENTPILGQIRVVKKSAQDNPGNEPAQGQSA